MSTILGSRERQHSAAPQYTQYHPRWYRSRVSVYWWLGQWRYLKFILREISSVFVAIFVVLTLFQLRALLQGPESYARFQAWLASPGVIGLNFVCFLFVIFHAITWFNLTPHALGVRVRGKRLPPFLVAAPNYAAWLVISAFVAWVIWR